MKEKRLKELKLMNFFFSEIFIKKIYQMIFITLVRQGSLDDYYEI